MTESAWEMSSTVTFRENQLYSNFLVAFFAEKAMKKNWEECFHKASIPALLCNHENKFLRFLENLSLKDPQKCFSSPFFQLLIVFLFPLSSKEGTGNYIRSLYRAQALFNSLPLSGEKAIGLRFTIYMDSASTSVFDQ